MSMYIGWCIHMYSFVYVNISVVMWLYLYFIYGFWGFYCLNVGVLLRWASMCCKCGMLCVDSGV